MSDRPSVLVVDAPALEACCDVLGLLGSDFVRAERTSAPIETLWPRDLLVTSAATGRELARRGLPALEPRPLWVCVHREDVGEIRPELAAAGVDYFVRAAGPEPDRELLRVLFLHALYQGAERRGELRLLCSHDVEYVVGGQRACGQLMDLSRTGFRLLGPRPFAPDTPLELHLPSALDPGPALVYPARVRRSAAALRGPDGQERTSIVARFAPSSSPVHAARIATVLETCAASALPALARAGRGDRRFAARHRYAGVAAVRCLDADEYCIVQGSNLSLSGMRLAFHPGLDIGVELSIGLHTGRGQPSVVVRGRVRHHDPSGLGVEFSALRPAESRALRALIDDLPHHGAISAGKGPEPLLFCSVRI